jgi:hypothetical protein
VEPAHSRAIATAFQDEDRVTLARASAACYNFPSSIHRPGGDGHDCDSQGCKMKKETKKKRYGKKKRRKQS